MQKRKVKVKLAHARVQLVPLVVLYFLTCLFESSLEFLKTLSQIVFLGENWLKSSLDKLQSISDTRF